MEPGEAHLRERSLQFLDVREDHEWGAGHIRNAVHIPLQQLPSRVEELDPGRRTVVVCQIG